MAQKWRPELRIFLAIFFYWKAVPQTFSLLECMGGYAENHMRQSADGDGDVDVDDDDDGDDYDDDNGDVDDDAVFYSRPFL